MKRLNYYRFLGLLSITLLLHSCQKEIIPKDNDAIDEKAVAKNSDKENTFYGPQVSVGDGKMRTFVTITHEGVPTALGIEMTEAAFNGLPSDPLDFAHEAFLLPLHQKAKDLTTIDHVMVNWEPEGHEPPGVYTLPHFDLHFYRISLEEQLAIPPYEVDPSKFDILPPAGYIPPPYFRTAGGVPQMGVHWIDPTSPEFTGQTFTHTFIYGSYNGEVSFYEPMVTRALLLSGTTLDKAIPQPTLFSPTNRYYSTHYKIWADGDKHYVALTEFVWH